MDQIDKVDRFDRIGLDGTELDRIGPNGPKYTTKNIRDMFVVVKFGLKIK